MYSDGPPRPYRYTRGKLSYETRGRWIYLAMCIRLLLWGFRRMKPLAYHPLAIIGLTVLVASYAINSWTTAAFFWTLLGWQRLLPNSYLRHVHPRIISFFAGFRYRYRPRRKLKANGLLSDDDPISTVSYVRKIGCTTKVRIKMSDGDSINYWRDQDRPNRLAQTYNALDCKIDPYRRDNFMTFRPTGLTLRPPFVQYKFEEKVTKVRWLELEFLTKDPFSKPVGFEYIDFHRERVDFSGEVAMTLGSPVGPKRDGTPYFLNVGTHLLVIAMSGRGKSNAERAMVYADYPLVMADLLENWIFDGKRGTEGAAMEHCFARHEYGKSGPEITLRFFRDFEAAMYRRLDEMSERGETDFVPDPGRRAAKLYIDEIMILESELYKEVRKDIYRSIAAVQQQGRAAGFSVIAFAQNPKLDRLPLRDDFPEIQIGGLLNRRQIDTAIAGGWDLGAKEIPKDLPGVFYIKTETGMALEQIRYAHDRYNAIKDLPQCPETAFNLTKEELVSQVRTGNEVLIA